MTSKGTHSEERRVTGRRQAWCRVVERMLAECAEGSPRNVASWAQQLAFAPVVPHALALWLREHDSPQQYADVLDAALELALAALGPLPDDPAVDPRDLERLSRRQARAIALDRRRVLRRLRDRLAEGDDTEAPTRDTVPLRMLRAYPLIGWNPEVEPAP